MRLLSNENILFRISSFATRDKDKIYICSLKSRANSPPGEVGGSFDFKREGGFENKLLTVIFKRISMSMNMYAS